MMMMMMMLTIIIIEIIPIREIVTNIIIIKITNIKKF